RARCERAADVGERHASGCADRRPARQRCPHHVDRQVGPRNAYSRSRLTGRNPRRDWMDVEVKKIATIAAALALTLVIPACGQGQEEGPQDELDIAWNAQPPTMDPLMATSNA